MKKILGLDLGTNSIGWAVVEIDDEKRIVRIIALGSRILPMDAGEMSKFENGAKLKSSASERTGYKSIRKNISRFILRRDRLHCVLNLLEMLPEHYKLDIEFINKNGNRSGKIKDGKEPKLAYYIDENGKSQFLFKESYLEMKNEFRKVHPEMFYQKENGKETNIPYDWTLYYLRKKALSQELTNEELAWVIMSFLQKRGYEKVMGQDEKEQKAGELSEIINAKVESIEELNTTSDDGLKKYRIKLADSFGNIVFTYDEEASHQISEINEFKQIEKISKLDNDGNIKSVEISISEIKNLQIVNIVNTHEREKDKTKFILQLSSGWEQKYLSSYEPNLKDSKKDFIIKSIYNQNGILKKRNIGMPKEEDWELEKLKTETSIQDYNAKNNSIGVASYIYNSLLNNPNQKIKAGLVTTIERRFYEEELKAILESQKNFHPYLKDEQKYQDALLLLYPNNETHRNTLAKQNFSSLLADDIIMYQRDLKTKKSLIADCKYEYREYIRNGKTIKEALKCVPKSNPFYQEFRLWQFIKRLRIIQLECENSSGEKLVNQDVTEQILTNSAKESLFSFLNDRKEVSQDAILKKIGLNKSEYKWNFEDDHIEPCNETRYDFVLRLKRIKKFDYEKFLSAKSKVRQSKETNNIVDCCTNEYQLWHFFYSVKKREERIKGLPKLIEKLLKNAGMESTWKNPIVEMLSSISTYKNDYGTYSEKAIKKLLPFLRLGKYWSREDVERIKTVDVIKPEVLTKENINGEITDLQGLWLSSACYLVYGRYAEVGDAKKWTQPHDIIKYLKKEFQHNSLNNPVVEKVVRETLMVVHDIWTTFGETDGTYYNEDNEEVQKYKKYFDRIHIEIGTSLKKNNKAKENDSRKNKENKFANERAIAMLKELKYAYKDVEIRENSPFQQEKFRIFESDIIDSIKYDKDDTKYGWENSNTTEKEFTKKEIKDLLKKEVYKISAKDIERYRLWLDQRYISPYTGKPIKLSELLDRKKYQIEHIFPQERVTLNSLDNKVICETIVNKAKGAMTGYEFILHGKNGKVTYNGTEIEILTPDKYVSNVKSFIANKNKQEILLSKDIPNKFGNNQMNNSKYIAKLAMGILSNIVREDDETEYKSKNVLVISGAVTNILKHDWQLDDAWNEIIKPRCIRLNNLLETNDYGEIREINGHSVFVPIIPDKDINKKRIDHRHHALDALIIALATNNHVNYINNISALDINTDRKNERKDLKAKYMNTVKHEDSTKEQHFLPPMQYKENGNIVSYKYTYKQSEPESIFKNVAVEALQNTIVTFKQKNRIMRQRTNRIQLPGNQDNNKELYLNQKKKYSVRQSLHKETYYGKRQIRPIAIEEAINNPENIVENKIKLIIQQYKQEGKTKDEIIKELKKTLSVVYVKEECATTQWSHTLDYFANISEDEKDKKTIKTGKSAIIREIECIADIAIQEILKRHLAKYRSMKMTVSEASNYIEDIVDEMQKEIVRKYIATGENGNEKVDVFVGSKEIKDGQISENPQIAFSSDGIKALNDNIVELNNGKKHKPIYKVQMIQALGKMFPVSEKEEDRPESVKNKQYVISNAGSNNYCGIYKTTEGETKTFVPSLKTTIESIRNNDDLFPKNISDKNKLYELKFIISPLDLVYMPTEDEIINNIIGNNIDYNRIFVVNDFNDAGTIYFRPYNIANEIVEHEIDMQKDSKGKLIGSRECKTAKCGNYTIRDYCVPIKVDRLGNIIEINGKKL